MRKFAKYIMTGCFLLFIFGLAIASLVIKDKDFSELENRTLEQSPEFEWKTFKSGEYSDKLENYLSDQLVKRDEFVGLKIDIDRAMAKNYINGVYFADNGTYLQDYHENEPLVKKNVQCINDFSEKVGKDVNMVFMLVPNAISIEKDKLPKFNQTDDQMKTVDKVKKDLTKKIDFYCPYQMLKNAYDKGTNVYYKTDHHWTSEGAKTGVEGLFSFMGESKPVVKYQAERIDDFYGTLYSKAPYTAVKPDSINLYRNPDNKVEVIYSVTSGDNDALIKQTGKKTDSFFVSDFKTQKDKYKTFFGGNFDLLRIKSQAKSKEKVLVIKDSYANSALPFLADKYSDISVIDMRYYHMQEELTVSEYIKKNKITKVIFLYNVDFFNSDNNFVWLD